MGLSSVLLGFKVAILLGSGFQQNEMMEPKKALEEAGATVYIVAPEEKVRGWDWFTVKQLDEFAVDVPLNQAKASDFDALLMPGGFWADELRIDDKAVTFVKGFADKPIGIICHGQWMMINAGLTEGKTMTSWPSIEKDLTNAGAHWVNQEVVRDGKLVTSRMPEDIPAFNKALIELFKETMANKKP